MRFICIALLVAVASLGNAAEKTTAKPTAVKATGEAVACSYYSRRYDGRRTAGGKRFSSNALTAAHRTYPMGSRLKVTNVANGKSAIVTVNDRGPFVKGRELSVTRRAARQMGFVKTGVAQVRIEQLR